MDTSLSHFTFGDHIYMSLNIYKVLQKYRYHDHVMVNKPHPYWHRGQLRLSPLWIPLLACSTSENTF